MFNPKYQITDEISRYLSDIAEIKSLVDHAKLLPAREFALRRTTNIKLAHSSTSIEGNSLEEYQVKKLLDGDKVIAQQDEIREVQNYFKALHLVDTYAIQSKITSNQILRLHKAVTEGLMEDVKIGAFRRVPIYIANGKQIIYTGPQANLVKQLISDLCDWLGSA